MKESKTAHRRRQSKRVRKEKITEPSVTLVDVPKNVDRRRHAEKTDPLPVFLSVANFAQVLRSERPSVVQCISHASTETIPFMDYVFVVESIPNHDELCESATVCVVQMDFLRAEKTKKVVIVKTKN